MHRPFQPGNAYGHNGKAGRPKGSRNKLCRAVLEDLMADWAEGGAAAIKIMRMERPAEYVRAMISILPKELILESGMDGFDDDTLDDLLAALHQRLIEVRQQALLPDRVTN
jgi:hypothetical protein